MKPLQYYKKQIFIMGCLGMFPMPKIRNYHPIHD